MICRKLRRVGSDLSTCCEPKCAMFDCRAGSPFCWKFWVAPKHVQIYSNQLSGKYLNCFFVLMQFFANTFWQLWVHLRLQVGLDLNPSSRNRPGSTKEACCLKAQKSNTFAMLEFEIDEFFEVLIGFILVTVYFASSCEMCFWDCTGLCHFMWICANLWCGPC